MEKFLVVYYGGKMPAGKAAQEKSMADWMAWFKGLGKAVVDMGAPTMPGKTVTSKGVESSMKGEPVGGYSVFQGESLDAVVKLVKTSPQLTAGGSVAVYPMMKM
jgi:hypothetical protein